MPSQVPSPSIKLQALNFSAQIILLLLCLWGTSLALFVHDPCTISFYSWYFYSLPLLLWKTPFPTVLRVILFVGVEVCWNIFPSYSSSLLFCIHLVILLGLWIGPCEYPYLSSNSSTQNKRD